MGGGLSRRVNGIRTVFAWGNMTPRQTEGTPLGYERFYKSGFIMVYVRSTAIFLMTANYIRRCYPKNNYNGLNSGQRLKTGSGTNLPWMGRFQSTHFVPTLARSDTLVLIFGSYGADGWMYQLTPYFFFQQTGASHGYLEP